ncbi:cation diffusion facilitator family transporter [Pedobacter sp. UYEF25]
MISLALSIVLMLAKFAAYFITDSNAIFSDAAESVVNIVASGFAFYSIYLTSRPKDENHPYGHGKVEFFSSFLEGILVLIAGLVIIVKAGYNFIYPQTISQLYLGTLVIGITGLANLLMGLYLIKVGTVERSITLKSDGKHLLTDTYTSVAVVIGLLLVQFTGLIWLDSLCAGLVAFYIVYVGYKLIRSSVAGLMDESDGLLVSQLANTLQENRQNAWIDVHNLRTQRYGPDLHIDCHVTLPYYFELTQVHQQISDFDELINKSKIGRAELFIHADPCLPQCCHYCHLENCPVRSERFKEEIVWTPELIVKNYKHFTNELL